MHQLQFIQAFKVPVEQLFEAWSNVDVMQKWFAPGEMTVPDAKVDFRVGGTYRIVMRDNKENQDFIVTGEYREIQPNQKLVFSWRWEGSPHTSLVTLTFRALETGDSELDLLHSEFADQDTRDSHQKGWNGCIARLIQHCA